MAALVAMLGASASAHPAIDAASPPPPGTVEDGLQATWCAVEATSGS